jgi:signal transduction histidine kinase
VLQHLEYVAAGGWADEPDVTVLREVAARAADELRAYVDGDRAETPRDLSVALDAVAADARLLTGAVRIRLVVGPDAVELPLPTVEALAAATREALANVAKHAGATRATVRAEVAGEAVVVRIEDDGAGFDPARTPFGSGLRHSVLDRIAAVGGTATVRSAPGAGTCVTLTVPLAATPAAEVVA